MLAETLQFPIRDAHALGPILIYEVVALVFVCSVLWGATTWLVRRLIDDVLDWMEDRRIRRHTRQIQREKHAR